MSLTLGVLSIQGDVLENVLAVKAAIDALGIDGTVTSVKTPDEISKVDGLVIPGGESTTIGRLSVANGALKILKEKIDQGMPVLGICAGMILLSKTAQDKVVGNIDQPLLDILDIKLERNSFGRQRESFESDISLNSIGIPSFNGVFIRAPAISDVEVLSKFNEKIVAIKKNNIIGVAFHPELTSDISLHKYFVNLTNTTKN